MKDKLVGFTLYLPNELHLRLKREAKRQEISMSELVRRLIDKSLRQLGYSN